MVKRLKVDKNFIPCPWDADDEMFRNGIFEFNITKMIGHIQENPNEFTLEEVIVDDIYISSSSVDESHIDSVDISKPVILAEIAPGRYNLIDGNHRMEKASRMGIKKMMAYRLNVDQHIKFLIDKKAYVTYVEYWNDKVR